MGINKNKILSLLLSCSLIMGVTSCKAEDKSFPELSFPDETKTSETTSGEDIDEASDDITKNIYSISMAVPYSQETINRLSKLYFLKVANNMPEDATGLTIDIDYLDSINTPWIINVIDTPNEGVGFSSVKFWYDNNDVPDIFLVDDLEKVVDGGFAAPLGNYINDYDIGSSGIYGNALTSCMKEDNAYGVPLYQSFMLMYGNMDYVPEDGPIGFRSTYSEFKSYLTLIDSTYNGEEQTIYPMAKAYEMIPYNTGSSYMFMDDSDEMIDSSLSVDLSFIDDLYEDGLAFDIDSNGIVRVSAKDMSTGNEQNVSITASTNLSEEDIDKAVKDAEAHAAEDKKKKEEVEVKNNAETQLMTALSFMHLAIRFACLIILLIKSLLPSLQHSSALILMHLCF